MTRRMASLPQIAAYWATHHRASMPDLLARNSMARPFCFHCGWRAPVPAGLSRKAAWAAVSGWLERAHLHDHWSGGPGTSDNLVPLCPLCHRIMPEYHNASDKAEAFVWVADKGHNSCPRWWQSKTDRRWSRPTPTRYIRFIPFLEHFVEGVHHEHLKDDALRLADQGNRDAAVARLSLLPGISAEDATVFLDCRTPELAVAA